MELRLGFSLFPIATSFAIALSLSLPACTGRSDYQGGGRRGAQLATDPNPNPDPQDSGNTDPVDAGADTSQPGPVDAGAGG
jgi:hypothetical protein